MRFAALLSLLLLSGDALLARGEVGSATPTAATPVTTTAAAAPIVLPTEKPFTAADRDAFIGTYAAQGTCTPSATCCCSTSPMTISAGALTNALQLAGAADGGAGCMGQASLAGSFTMYEPSAAYAYLSFVPVLMELRTDSSHQLVQLNTTKTDCPIIFQRTIAAPPAVAAPVTSALPAATGTAAAAPVTSTTPAAATAAPATSTAAATVPTIGGQAMQVPVQNADGTVTLPPTSFGSGANQFTLPATTLQPLGAAQPSLNSNAFGSTNTGAAAISTPVISGGQQTATAQPALSSSTAPLMPNPFGNSQASLAAGSGSSSTSVLSPPIQPVSTSIPFGATLPNLPNGGSATPFDASALVATPVATTAGGAAAANTGAIGGNTAQLPAIGSVGGALPQLGGFAQPQLGALPSMGSPFPAAASSSVGSPAVGTIAANPLTGSAVPTIGSAAAPSTGFAAPTLGGALPSFGSAAPAIGSALPSGPIIGSSSNPVVGTATTTPIGSGSSSTTTTPSTSTATAPIIAPSNPAPISSSPGSFSTAAVSANGASVAQSAVAYTPVLLELSGSDAAAGSKNYLAALVIPAAANISSAILHYFTMDDMRQKNVPMVKVTSSSLATQVVRSAGPLLQVGSAYDLWAFAPIALPADDALTYSYTFAAADAASARNSEAFVFPSATMPTAAAVQLAPDAAAELHTQAATSSSSDTASADAVNVGSAWNGQFMVDASCVPSADCCCGVGLVNVSTTFGAPGSVLLSGELDGGAGCLYQKSLTGLMAVNTSNSNMASRAIEIPNEQKTVISFYAALSSSSSAAASSSSSSSAPDVLTISNSFRQCRTTANKIASFAPAVDNSSVEETELPANLVANSSTHANALPRDAFVGEWSFDKSCVPSASCCCAQGPLSISAVNESTVLPPLPGALAAGSTDSSASTANRSALIIFSTELDGGSACVGMKNVSQAFTVANASAASFDFSPVRLDALLSQSDASAGSGLDTITFINSMYPQCLSRASKKSNILQPSDVASSSSSSPLSPQPDDSAAPLSSTLSAADAAALRDSLVGDYTPSGCVASASCCCATGLTKVRANSSAPALLDVDTALAGSGFSCLQKDGLLHMTFTLTNKTSAESAPFTGVNAKFYAKLTNQSNTFLVSNTVHPLCPTTFTRVVPPKNGATSTSASLTLMAVLALAAAALRL